MGPREDIRALIPMSQEDLFPYGPPVRPKELEVVKKFMTLILTFRCHSEQRSLLFLDWVTSCHSGPSTIHTARTYASRLDMDRKVCLFGK